MSTQRVTVAELRARTKGSYAAHEQLQEDALRYLALNGLPAVPIHTGPRVRPRPGGGFDLKRNTAQHGVFDILTCLPPLGRLALLDAKSGQARLSREQREVRRRFTAAGALCLEFGSIADLDRGLSAHHAVRMHSQGGSHT